jgi:hypothetical protein
VIRALGNRHRAVGSQYHCFGPGFGVSARRDLPTLYDRYQTPLLAASIRKLGSNQVRIVLSRSRGRRFDHNAIAEQVSLAIDTAKMTKVLGLTPPGSGYKIFTLLGRTFDADMPYEYVNSFAIRHG